MTHLKRAKVLTSSCNSRHTEWQKRATTTKVTFHQLAHPTTQCNWRLRLPLRETKRKNQVLGKHTYQRERVKPPTWFKCYHWLEVIGGLALQDQDIKGFNNNLETETLADFRQPIRENLKSLLNKSWTKSAKPNANTSIKWAGTTSGDSTNRPQETTHTVETTDKSGTTRVNHILSCTTWMLLGYY